MSHLSRRHFLARCTAGLGALLLPLPALSAVRRNGHPTPRQGVTGAKVLTKDQLKDAPQLVELFDGVRAIPQIADGIRCNCGCAEIPGMYSLLSCYEGDAMAKACPICQGEGRLAVRLHKEGKSLDEIRTAIDAVYG